MKRIRSTEEQSINRANYFSCYPTTVCQIKPDIFFKLILSPSQSNRLRLPEEFTRAYRDELSTTAVLTVPSGETWTVSVLEEDDKLWLHDNGWQAFVEYFSIRYAFFLLFKYNGTSNFSVNIFDPTSCEISYQCNNSSSTSQPRQAPCPVGSSDSEVIQPVPCPVQCSEAEVIQIDSDEEDKDEEIKDARKNVPFENTKWLENHQGLLKAVVAAGICLPEKPFFVAEIKPYSLSYASFLCVPMQFGRNLLGCSMVESKYVKFEGINGGRQWTVKFNRHTPRGSFSFGAGWIFYARDVGLAPGDVCLFELTDAKNDVIRVHIAKKSQIKAVFV